MIIKTYDDFKDREFNEVQRDNIAVRYFIIKDSYFWTGDGNMLFAISPTECMSFSDLERLFKEKCEGKI